MFNVMQVTTTWVAVTGKCRGISRLNEEDLRANPTTD